MDVRRFVCLVVFVSFFGFAFFFGVTSEVLAASEYVGLDGAGGAQAIFGEAWMVGEYPTGEPVMFRSGRPASGGWAAFHCTKAGTHPCATDLTPTEATKIGEGRFTFIVPAAGERTYIGKHAYSSYTCGRIQYDIGVDGAGTVGGWVYNFGADCGTVSSHPNACGEYREVNTQFRRSGRGDTPWFSGKDFKDLTSGETIDVNCFAKTGTALLPGAKIIVKKPLGTETFAGAELRDYRLSQKGTYWFTCTSETVNSCSDSDQLVVSRWGRVLGMRTARVRTIQTGGGELCKDLRVVWGKLGLAPAKVKFEAKTAGEVLTYRYSFGDGSEVTVSDKQVTHEYRNAGTYEVAVAVKDRRGNWYTTNVCREQVRILPWPW